MGMATFCVPWVFFMTALILLGDRTRMLASDTDPDFEMMPRSEPKTSKEKADTIKKNTTLAW
jgi:hypothetical protein